MHVAADATVNEELAARANIEEDARDHSAVRQVPDSGEASERLPTLKNSLNLPHNWVQLV
jgi:hypothetical protein